MSLILHFKIPGAIVAASDCRITGTEQVVEPVRCDYTEDELKYIHLDRAEELRMVRSNQLHTNSLHTTISHYNFIKTDSEQKTFLLVNEYGNPFAISYCGNANLLGTPTSFQIRFALSQMKDAKTTLEISEKIRSLWNEKKIEDMPSLLISGYNNGKPSVLELRSDGSTVIEHFEDPNLYGVTYHGEQDVMKALIGLGDFQWSLYRLEDAINFCDLMLTTTARIQSLQRRQQTVSEKYDLLVITEDKGRWIKRNSLEV